MINYQKYREEFDSFLDENGEIAIGSNFSMFPSQILLGLDETAYDEQLRDYVDQKKSDYSLIVYQNFPAPIAYFYQQAELAFDNDNHRLQLLRSTWESVIFILYALILGEVNHRRFDLKDVRIFDGKKIKHDHNGIMSDRLGWKVEAMQKIIEFDQENDNQLVISSYINSDVFEIIKGLNHERNSFSHIAALTPSEARQRFEEIYPEVSDLLFELDFLENVSLIRFATTLGHMSKIRFNRFDGHSLQKQNYDKLLSASELTTYSLILSDEILLMEFDSILFNVSPFIHFQ